MKALPDLLGLDDGARLTDIMCTPLSRDVASAPGGLVMQTAIGTSEFGSTAGTAVACFLSQAVVVLNGVQADGRDWFAIFEHFGEPMRRPAAETVEGRLTRALELTGVRVEQRRSHTLSRDDVHAPYAARSTPSVEDWSVLDLLLGSVINLWVGDLSAVVESVLDGSVLAGAAHRRRRLDELMRAWATQYQGPEPR